MPGPRPLPSMPWWKRASDTGQKAFCPVSAHGGRPRAVANGGRAEVPGAPPRRCSGQKRVPGAGLALGEQREQIRSTRAACSQRSITAETDDPNATHGSPQGWSEAVVAQEASCKARYGHRRSLSVYLDTVHSLSSSWDPILGNKAGSFTRDKDMSRSTRSDGIVVHTACNYSYKYSE